MNSRNIRLVLGSVFSISIGAKMLLTHHAMNAPYAIIACGLVATGLVALVINLVRMAEGN